MLDFSPLNPHVVNLEEFEAIIAIIFHSFWPFLVWANCVDQPGTALDG